MSKEKMKKELLKPPHIIREQFRSQSLEFEKLMGKFFDVVTCNVSHLSVFLAMQFLHQEEHFQKLAHCLETCGW